MPERRSWLPLVLVVALVYLVVGLATAYLAGAASSVRIRTVWRLLAWALSFAAFAGQIVYERVRLRSAVVSAALHASAAVALGALALAAAGPVRSHWGMPNAWRVALLSLVVWPIVTGVPAFLVALGAGAVIRRGATPRSAEIDRP